MKRVHLLRVEAEGSVFAELFECGADCGQRGGWLDLSGLPAAADELSAGKVLSAVKVTGERPELPLGTLASRGALRAVRVSETATMSVKQRKGAPVLRDLVREYFLGCAWVLVRSAAELPVRDAAELPLLTPETAGGWRVSQPTGDLTFDGEKLLAAFRKARPFSG